MQLMPEHRGLHRPASRAAPRSSRATSPRRRSTSPTARGTCATCCDRYDGNELARARRLQRGRGQGRRLARGRARPRRGLPGRRPHPVPGDARLRAAGCSTRGRLPARVRARSSGSEPGTPGRRQLGGPRRARHRRQPARGDRLRGRAAAARARRRPSFVQGFDAARRGPALGRRPRAASPALAAELGARGARRARLRRSRGARRLRGGGGRRARPRRHPGRQPRDVVRPGPRGSSRPAAIDATLAVNVRATLLLVQAFAARHDDARPGGRVSCSPPASTTSRCRASCPTRRARARCTG